MLKSKKASNYHNHDWNNELPVKSTTTIILVTAMISHVLIDKAT